MKQIINKLIDICKMTQEELLGALPSYLEKHYSKDKIHNTDRYIYVEGDIPVLLVAHLDTVHLNTPKNIWVTLDQSMIKSDTGIGGDDRCGVYALNHLATKKMKPYLLYTTDEEVGCIGAQGFCDDYTDIPVNCIIEIDRKGSKDVIVYDDTNPNLYKKFVELGFKLNYGSFTDISYLCPHFGISGVNLSSGYYHPHTNDEFINVIELQENIDLIYRFLENAENYSDKYLYIQSLRTSFFNSYKYLYRDDCCDYCGSHISGLDEEFGTPDGILCETCFNRLQEYYTICPDCDEIVYNDKYCDYCGRNLEEKDDV